MYVPTAEDFTTVYDKDYTAPFLETEDGSWFSYGWVDPEIFVQWVLDHDLWANREYADLTKEFLTPLVKHSWAKITSEVDDEWRFGYSDEYENEEGSFKITYIY
jgi:hypothetical protein